MKVLRSLLAAAAWTALFTLIGGVAAQAQAPSPDAASIGYRQKLMQARGFHAGSMGAILKGEWPKEDAVGHARALAANAMLTLNAFKKQTADVKTDAKPEIWKEWAEFEKYAKAMQVEADKLAEVAAGGNMADMGAQMKKVGEACGACHKEFRKKKEESYKEQK